MIDVYVSDILNSLKNRSYFSALSLALTLPDICGMAEYSENTNVANRYINWYDRYLGEYMQQEKEQSEGGNPWLSGEIVYNLRNTFLHQGSPNVIGSRVKNENNQIDKFMLILGDGSIQEITLSADVGHGKMKYKAIIVDVTYLCNCICDCALWYYKKNRKKFHFDFWAVSQEEILNPHIDSPPLLPLADMISEVINKKAEVHGDIMGVSTVKDKDLKNDENKAKLEKESDEKQTKRAKKKSIAKKSDADIEASKPSKKEQTEKEKRESQIRSFYGQHFKKQIYKDKKEQIIQILLKAKTRQQVNNGLTKLFRSEEAGRVFRRIQPLIKDLPGK